MKIRMQFWSKNEKGQAIIVVALFFFFAFLVFAALSVDGTIIYLRRRQLQNMADAAALAAAEQLSQSKTEAVAYQKAMDSIDGNGGRIDWYSTSATPNPLGTNVGSGLSLTKGVEITDACDVRVALQWSDMGTYFTQFFGRETLQVGARAHASCSKAGGLQPIAVKRFGDEFDTDDTPPPPNVKDPNTIYCKDCDIRRPLLGQGNDDAYDFLRPEVPDIITTWPTGTLIYASPSPHADLASGAPGREYYTLGGGVKPNVGTTSYGGWVNLDIRHVAFPPREYYNNVSPGTGPNTLKYLGEYYIRRGYCCDIPIPGDEVAMLSGVSADFAAKAFQETYNIGDVVAVIVYNGTVYHAPILEMTGSPDFQQTRPTTTTVEALNSAAVTYTISLEGKFGFVSQSTQGLTMNVEGLEGFADWDFSPTDSPDLPDLYGNNVADLTLHITPSVKTTVTTVGTTTLTTTHVITGTRMFYVSAIDDELFLGTGARRYWAGAVTIGDIDDNGNDRDLPAVTGTPTNTDQNYPFLTVVQGNQAKYSIELDLWGGAGNQPVTVDFVGAEGFGSWLPTGFSWVGAPPWSKATKADDPPDPPGATFNLNIKVDDTSTPNTTEELTFLTSAGAMTQTFKLYVQVVPPQTTTVEDFLVILGYAALEVTDYPNVNSVRGRIVSELWDDPSKLIYGLRARLIPWDH